MSDSYGCDCRCCGPEGDAVILAGCVSCGAEVSMLSEDWDGTPYGVCNAHLWLVELHWADSDRVVSA